MSMSHVGQHMQSIFWKDLEKSCSGYSIPSEIQLNENYCNFLYETNTLYKFDQAVWRFLKEMLSNTPWKVLKEFFSTIAYHLRWIHIAQGHDFAIVSDMICLQFDYIYLIEPIKNTHKKHTAEPSKL